MENNFFKINFDNLIKYIIYMTRENDTNKKF